MKVLNFKPFKKMLHNWFYLVKEPDMFIFDFVLFVFINL